MLSRNHQVTEHKQRVFDNLSSVFSARSGSHGFVDIFPSRCNTRLIGASRFSVEVKTDGVVGSKPGWTRGSFVACAKGVTFCQRVARRSPQGWKLASLLDFWNCGCSPSRHKHTASHQHIVMSSSKKRKSNAISNTYAAAGPPTPSHFEKGYPKIRELDLDSLQTLDLERYVADPIFRGKILVKCYELDE